MEIKWRLIEKDDYHETLEEFIETCKSGFFIDYDGYGSYATINSVSNIDFVPSDLLDPNWENPYPGMVTHVVWYNR